LSDVAERLRDLDLAPGYDSGDDALAAFYIPALRVAVRYDRSVGYFRSTALAVAARGVSRFIAHGGRMRLGRELLTLGGPTELTTAVGLPRMPWLPRHILPLTGTDEFIELPILARRPRRRW